jgi:hypothetical protein
MISNRHNIYSIITALWWFMQGFFIAFCVSGFGDLRLIGIIIMIASVLEYLTNNRIIITVINAFYIMFSVLYLGAIVLVYMFFARNWDHVIQYFLIVLPIVSLIISFLSLRREIKK